MLIPRYWARAQGNASGGDKESFALNVWGWSDTSQDHAQIAAGERLQKLCQRIAHGSGPQGPYSYGDRALREEIIEELPGEDPPAAIITRNRYGCLILNTARALFIDVDFVHQGMTQRFFDRLFRRPGVEVRTLDALRISLKCYPTTTFRIYRTAAGFRVLAVNRLFTPESPESTQIMEACGADPSFVRLCSVQKSFRARLTAKPWRCNTPPPPGQHPREGRELAHTFLLWLRQYDQAAKGFATCRFIETVGGEKVAEALMPIVTVHDKMTRANADLPLA